MAGIDADIWVCGDCRSINNLRSKQCYRCRTPRDVAAVDPAQVEGTGHGKLREIALPAFRSSRGAALLASALLIFLAVMQIVSTVADTILMGRVLDDPGLLTDPTFATSVESLVAGTIAVATLGVALLALIGWAFWLSRVVMAMPALGLGYPPTNGTMAFVENFLPGLNLFRVPAIVRDVIRRLEPDSLRSEALIFAAWIGLFGGYLMPRFGGYLGLFGSGTLEEAVRRTILVQAAAAALVVFGTTFLVALIWWIERRVVRRQAAQLEGEPAVAGAVAAAAVATEAPSATGPAYIAASTEVSDDQPFEPPPGDEALESSGELLTAPISEAGPLSAAGPLAAAALPVAMARSSASEATVDDAAPVGTEPPPTTATAEAASEQMLNRPITAVTGAASIASRSPEGSLPDAPSDAASDAPPLVAEVAAVAVEPSPATPEPPVEPDAAGTDEPAPEPVPPDLTTTGPQLHLRVESASSMIATMDGESEPITLDELRAAAVALARAHGSAVIVTEGTSFGALSLAEQAFAVLTDADVGTTVEE